MAFTTIDPYEIKEGAKLVIKNIKTLEGTGKDAYVREDIVRGTDGKIETPDAGRITKFGPVEIDKTVTPNVEYIKIPAAYAAVRLPLYRAGAGTTVIIPAEKDTEETPAKGIVLTPTLSEEVVYYIAACEDLGLTCDYGYDA